MRTAMASTGDCGYKKLESCMYLAQGTFSVVLVVALFLQSSETPEEIMNHPVFVNKYEIYTILTSQSPTIQCLRVTGNLIFRFILQIYLQ